MSKKLSMRVATHALIAGLVFTTGGYGAFASAESVAHVDPSLTQGKATQAPAPKLAGTITIHKKLNPTSFGTPTGENDGNVKGDAFNGVQFSVQRLTWDITTNDGLKAAAAKTVKDAEGAIDSSFNTLTAATSTDGTASFTNLPVGAYLVKELPISDDVKKAAKLDGATITPASPFIAFVPMTASGTSNGWNYNVVAYPKNNSFTLKKALGSAASNQSAQVGDDITYDITGDRPVFDANTQYVDFYQIIDQKPAGLNYKSVTVKIGSTALTENTDYTVTGTDGNSPTVTLTVAGENELMKASHAGDKVVASFTFRVDAIMMDKTNGFKRINNGTANVHISSRTTPPQHPETPEVPPAPGSKTPQEPTPSNPPKGGTTTPSNPVTETWIPVKITKVDASNSAKKLQGAKFQVFTCKAANPEKTEDGAIGKVDAKSQPITIAHGSQKGENTFTTGSDGSVTIDALRLRVDNGTDKRATDDGYCLVETDHPEGYEKLPKPYFFRFASDQNVEKDLTVEDTPSVAPKLPATGGMGVGILMALGAIVVGAGAFFARRSSKAEA